MGSDLQLGGGQRAASHKILDSKLLGYNTAAARFLFAPPGFMIRLVFCDVKGNTIRYLTRKYYVEKHHDLFQAGAGIHRYIATMAPSTYSVS